MLIGTSNCQEQFEVYLLEVTSSSHSTPMFSSAQFRVQNNITNVLVEEGKVFLWFLYCSGEMIQRYVFILYADSDEP